MQKLFSQEIRFKGDNGNDFAAWEEKKAKEIFKNHSNKSHDGSLPILSASQEFGMIYRDGSGINIQASEKSVKSYKIVEPNDFVITLRSFQGGLDFSSLLGICSPAYTILKNRVAVNYFFYKFYFKKVSFIERLSKTVVGIRDGKQITFENFGSLKIPYPSLPEQQKIANFLSSIDQQIEQIGVQIGQSQEFKKGLLQQMFV
jgi:type I restriction enzyme S subunit